MVVVVLKIRSLEKKISMANFKIFKIGNSTAVGNILPEKISHDL